MTPSLPHISAPDSTAITIPAHERLIDWEAEAKTAVDNIMAKIERDRTQRKFSGADRKQRLPLDTKGASKPEFAWSKESTERFGLTPEGLFFLRLSERCMIVAVFLGCAFGELPPPRGDLFEHMGDPNVPTGSVPEVNDEPIEGLE